MDLGRKGREGKKEGYAVDNFAFWLGYEPREGVQAWPPYPLWSIGFWTLSPSSFLSYPFPPLIPLPTLLSPVPQGIEMDADFDGELHDIDAPKDDDGDEEPSDDEAGDEERIEQQMGEDLGDNQEVRRWWRYRGGVLIRWHDSRWAKIWETTKRYEGVSQGAREVKG
jgi:hypothetical protein